MTPEEERASGILKSIARHSDYISINHKDNIAYLVDHFKELIETEREACAKIADEYGHKWTDSVAQAIRAR